MSPCFRYGETGLLIHMNMVPFYTWLINQQSSICHTKSTTTAWSAMIWLVFHGSATPGGRGLYTRYARPTTRAAATNKHVFPPQAMIYISGSMKYMNCHTQHLWPSRSTRPSSKIKLVKCLWYKPVRSDWECQTWYWFIFITHSTTSRVSDTTDQSNRECQTYNGFIFITHSTAGIAQQSRGGGSIGVVSWLENLLYYILRLIVTPTLWLIITN